MNERVILLINILLGVLLLIGFIYAFFFAKKRIEQKNMNEKFKSSVSELLYTFFFGYAAFKWRRLIRTLILITSVGGLISGVVAGLFLDGVKLIFTFVTIGTFSGVSLVIGLISWLIKPFVVKED